MAHTFISAIESVIAVGAGGPSIDIDLSMLIEMGLFLGIWFMLTVLVFKPYLKARSEREALTEGARGEAETFSNEAAELLERCERSLNEAREAANEKREGVTKDAVDRASSKRAEARSKSEQTLADERARIQQELAIAREAMGPQIDEISSAIVKKVMVA